MIGNSKGMVLILTFMMMVVMTFVVAAFLSMNAVRTKGIGYDIPDAQALWLAEAGLQQAIWNLKTPVASGGQGDSWTSAGTTLSLGSGTYTMVVVRWDFALAANGSTARASSTQGTNVPARAIDGNNATFWESRANPSVSNPQFITIAFPYTLTINRARFVSPVATNRPRNYTWQVSADNMTYTTVVTVTENGATDVTHTFTNQTNVNYLRLRVTRAGGSSHVRVSLLESPGSQIISTGTVNSLSRQIRQTAVANSSTQTAHDEIDWIEL